MLKSKNIVVKLAKNIAEKALKMDANSTTCVAIYQPKVPANLDRFKKND